MQEKLEKAIWHLAFWQNWCFGQFYHSKNEVFQNCSAFFVSISLVRLKFERIKRKSRSEKSSQGVESSHVASFSPNKNDDVAYAGPKIQQTKMAVTKN